MLMPRLSPVLIRRIILDQSKRANLGHIGSALSIADLVAALYSGSLRGTDPGDPDRDRFVLSKGHACLAVYAALFLKGVLSEDELNTFGSDGSRLGVHPEHNLPGIDFSTGSLGHGLSIGAGAALAARLQGSSRRSFVLLSDAECNEGSVWEAAMFAAHHRLANLVALIDLNGQQALGRTDDVLALTDMAGRWHTLNWDVHEVDGHNVAELMDVLAALDTACGPPHVLVARTVFGKGVPYMERQVRWHYDPMSDEDYRLAVAAVETY
jgi:transketolase